MGLFDGLAEGIGKAAAPIKPALDFVLPQQDPSTMDQGINGIGDLFGALGAGAMDAVREGPAGLVNAGVEALTGGGNARERLLMGGIALAGGAMYARAAHKAWKQDFTPGPSIKKASASGSMELVAMGDPARHMDVSVNAEAYLRAKPGTTARTAQIMAHSDSLEVAKGFGRWAPDDEVQQAAGASLFQAYADLIPEGGDGAQVDIARFNTAMSKGLFKYENNKEVRDLWKRLTETPDTLLGDKAKADTAALFDSIRAFGDATNGVVDDDLAIGIVGGVTRVDVVPGGVAIYVKHPVGWNDGMAVDPVVRNARLREVNYRALAADGKENLRHLYNVGIRDMADVADGKTTIFNKPLELGPKWYPQALADVQRVFGVNVADNPDEVNRAVAAVSFLSEAEDWKDNIVKAQNVLTHMGDVSQEDFQNWLRNGIKPDINGKEVTKYAYMGSSAAFNEKRFQQIFKDVTGAGFKVDEKTLKKVMRLWGGLETVDEVFLSTSARKQKNFYRNIRFPDERHPVTIDRHAFDAFAGMDAGIQDRPLDLSVLDGDQVYDVVADTYRQLAEEMGVAPHELQAVIWETWRAYKDKAGRDGWSRNDPVMLERGGGPNKLFEALHGRGPAFEASLDPSGPMNMRVLEAHDVAGLTSIGDPNGSVVIAADATEASASLKPNLYPAVDGVDRTPRWARVVPRRFQDLKRYLAEVSNPNTDSVTFINSELDAAGGLPGLRGETIIVGFVDDGAKVRVSAKDGKVSDLARVAHEAPVLNHERLGIEDLDADSFQGPNSPMNTHAWAIISAQMNDEQIAVQGLSPWNSNVPKGATDPQFSSSKASNQMLAQLQREGYKPIRAKGKYLGTAENSFLIFGISAEDARVIGEKFGQDSVNTNAGFVYNRQFASESANNGVLEQAGGASFDGPTVDAADGSTEIVIDGKTIKWTLTTWGDTVPADEVADSITERSNRSRRMVQIAVKPGVNVKQLADELHANGTLQEMSVYANQSDLEGWSRGYEKYATDGRQTVVTRHATGAIGSPNGRHVFTRDATKFPPMAGPGSGGLEQLAEGKLILGGSLSVDTVTPAGVAAVSEPWRATLNGQSTRTFGYRDGTLSPIFGEADPMAYDAVFKVKVSDKGKLSGTVEAPDGNDLTSALEAREAVREAGWDAAFELRAGGKTFKFSKEAEAVADKQVSVTRAGTVKGRVRLTRPVAAFEEAFGFQGDFSYRDGNEIVDLEPHIQQGAFDLTAKVMDLHADAIQRWRLGGVVTVDMDNYAYAWMDFQAGGRILLPAGWWSNPEEFSSAIRKDRSTGKLSHRLDDSPMGILAHEFGHVLHGALRLEERMVKNSQIDKDLKQLVKAHGKGSFEKVVEREIGTIAAKEPAELVAEAFSEFLLAPNPSRLSKNVYDLINDRLGNALKFRKAINF